MTVYYEYNARRIRVEDHRDALNLALLSVPLVRMNGTLYSYKVLPGAWFTQPVGSPHPVRTQLVSGDMPLYVPTHTAPDLVVVSGRARQRRIEWKDEIPKGLLPGMDDWFAFGLYDQDFAVGEHPWMVEREDGFLYVLPRIAVDGAR